MEEAHGINIRNLSVRPAIGDEYPTLVRFRRTDEANVYVFEREDDPDPAATRIEIAVALRDDVFARRDPSWHGGRIHAGEDGDGEVIDARPPEEGVDVDRLVVTWGAEATPVAPVHRSRRDEDWHVYGFAAAAGDEPVLFIEVPTDRDTRTDR